MKKGIETHMNERVLSKYTIMKIRLKISFIAFINNQTVLECFLMAIKKSHSFLKASRQLKD